MPTAGNAIVAGTGKRMWARIPRTRLFAAGPESKRAEGGGWRMDRVACLRVIRVKPAWIVALVLAWCAVPGRAEDPLPNVERLQTSPVLRHLKPNPLPAPPRTPAEETLAQMYRSEERRVGKE